LNFILGSSGIGKCERIWDMVIVQPSLGRKRTASHRLFGGFPQSKRRGAFFRFAAPGKNARYLVTRNGRTQKIIKLDKKL